MYFNVMFLGMALFLAVCPLPAQKLVFDQYVKNNKVGILWAEKTQSGPLTTFHIRSEVKFQMMVSVDVDYEMVSTYQQNILESSEVKVFRKGELKEHTQVRRVAGGYEVNRDGQVSLLRHSGITFSSARLYFEEPRQMTSIFSEQKVVFNPVTVVEQKNYRLSPDHKKQPNYYRYGPGGLQRVEVGFWLADIVFVRREGVLLTDNDRPMNITSGN